MNEILSGKFEYIRNDSDKKILSTAYMAITMTENWLYIKQCTDYEFTPELCAILNKINELGYCGHSGSSFTSTMRVMKYIANYGEQKFKNEKI